MRGEDRTSGALFSYVDVEARIPAQHPLRAMRRLTNAALSELDPRISALYEGIGRPSIPRPSAFCELSLLQLLYSIRSERQLVERWEFDMLFQAGSSGLRSTRRRSTRLEAFSKNRDRLLTHEIAQGFLASLLGLPEVKRLLSAEHFSVDGTMLKAWASMKEASVRRTPRAKARAAAWASRRRGATARSTSARPSDRTRRTPRRRTRTRAFMRKGAGQESRLAYLGHTLMENRQRARLWRQPKATLASGTGEREAAARMSQRLPKGATLGADKGYDAEAFVEGLKARGIEPHIAINGTVSKHGVACKTAVPSEVSRERGLCDQPAAAQAHRGRLRLDEDSWRPRAQVKVRGLDKVRAAFIFAMAAYNIVRLPKLMATRGEPQPAT